MDTLDSLLGRSGYLPHGYCFTWAPGLLWPMVVADALIALAYFSIPLAILSYVRRRGNVPHPTVVWLFCAFIFACGITHLLDVWTIWRPDYAVQMLSKVVTAGVSVTTALALWPLIPRALRLPSRSDLATAIGALESEVSRRKTAEERLREIEQSLSVTLASIGAGFIAADRGGRVTRMNAVAERVTGWTQAEATGLSLWQVFDREGRAEHLVARNPVDLMVELGVTVETVQHVTAIARDGARTPLELRAALTHDEAGALRGLAMVFRDVTQMERVETEMHRLAAIVASSADAIISKGLDGRITSWNAAAEALLGYTAAEAIGQPIQMLIPADREAEEGAILAELALGHTVRAYETQRRAKDGRLIALSVTISPVRDAFGRIVGAAKIARDLSHLKRTESALRDSEARLRFALESAQIGDWSLALETGRMTRSAHHDRCFGYDQPLPAWSIATFLHHVHPQDRAEAQAVLQDALDRRADWQHECRVVWPDASVHWIRMHGSVPHGSGAEPLRMLGIVMETTARRQAEEARLKAERLEAENRQIQESNRIKNQFLANMSHELRTPLNAIIGFADLLRAGAVPPDSDRQREYLGHIGSSGRHLLQLINDVLDLAKVESGKFEFAPEPVELARLAGEVADVLQPALQRKHLALAVDIAPALHALFLDGGRLKQVLYNYLSNAIKFTPEGGRVTLRARPVGADRFRVEVEDTGIGIAEADLGRLFVEFQQLDAGYDKKHAGTGLGLALTRRLVEAQGGSVGVRSTLGQGSVFHLVLARAQRPADGAAPPLARARRLLVVEPDEAHRLRLVRGLTAAGFAVDAAADAEEALARAGLAAYDALSFNLRLPGPGGLGLLARIREGGASRAAAVVGITVAAAPGAVASFGVTDVLAKPLDADALSATLRRLNLPTTRRPRILVIDDDPLALSLMQEALHARQIDTLAQADGRLAGAASDDAPPDALVLALAMPGFDGFAVLDALQQRPGWRWLPVLLWTPLVLTTDETARLAQSARAILRRGGGALEPLLERLREGGPHALADADPGAGRG